MGIAAKNNHKAGFPAWEYATYFKHQLPEVGSVFSMRKVQEPGFSFTDMKFAEGDNVDLYGYLQSEKYFKHIETEVRRMFEFATSTPLVINGWEWHNIPTCAVHLRFGDYLNNPTYINLGAEYYYKACKHIAEQVPGVVFCIFSDDHDQAKGWFTPFNHIMIKGNKDIDDLRLMSSCDHMIMANSSFSWWAAWLGKKEGQIVVRPAKYFQPDQRMDESDLWLQEWINIDTIEHKPYAMKDVSITIPVMYDHQDRIENLEIVLKSLRHHFDCEIIVMEQGQYAKFDFVRDKYKVNYHHIVTESPAFHRTKMLNDMAKLAQGDIILNWDADCLINPMQVMQAVQLLREKKSDVVFPYNGWFSRIERSQIPLLDINLVEVNKHLPGEPHGSVGGCIAWNKQKYFEAGGENENFISYGAEDVERVARIKKLELNLQRIDGPIIHINHYVGPNSSTANPYFQQNDQELTKINSMSKAELQEYIAKWPWKEIYSKEFFAEINKGSTNSALSVLTVLKNIVVDYRTLIDVGCGQGAWLQVAEKLGVYSHGIDGEYVKREFLLFESIDNFIEHDLEEEIRLNKMFDLAICLEVAEHLSKERAESFVANLCKLSHSVLFSAAIPGQNGNGHINEQWQSYWSKLFKANGYTAYEIRDMFWDDKDVEYWYKQNMVLYSKRRLTVPEVRIFDIVHPDKFAVANAR